MRLSRLAAAWKGGLLGVATLGLLAAAPAPAPIPQQAVPPLGAVKIVLVKDLHAPTVFQLDPVELSACETSSVTGLTTVRCAIEGGRQVTIPGHAGQPDAVLNLSSFVYLHKTLVSSGPFHEYYFKGTWEQTVDGVALKSDATLLVWYHQDNSDDLRGFLKIEKYGLSHGLQGARL